MHLWLMRGRRRSTDVDGQADPPVGRHDRLPRIGEGGLLARMTKLVVESALEGEMDDHLGYAKHDPSGRDGGNSRNGKRAKPIETLPAVFAPGVGSAVVGGLIGSDQLS
ncbi:transposase [Nocardia sp. CWNU-33]|uniref:transposase n=1 Tax=Nocardia sp. CWNU-33 TaxID=3392117 RepID=UPI00398E9F97